MTKKKSGFDPNKRKNEKRGAQAFPTDYVPQKPKDRKRTTISLEEKLKNTIEVQLDSRTWVMAKIPYDIEALRKKYLRK